MAAAVRLRRDLTCLDIVSLCVTQVLNLSCIPKSALNAGSILPPLALNTAFTTAASMEGNASFNVFSACCSGARGRGGFGGGASSIPGCGVVAEEEGLGGDAGVSIGSSSKSSAFAVVGDSGRGSDFYRSISKLHLGMISQSNLLASPCPT